MLDSTSVNEFLLGSALEASSEDICSLSSFVFTLESGVPPDSTFPLAGFAGSLYSFVSTLESEVSLEFAGGLLAGFGSLLFSDSAPDFPRFTGDRSLLNKLGGRNGCSLSDDGFGGDPAGGTHDLPKIASTFSRNLFLFFSSAAFFFFCLLFVLAETDPTPFQSTTTSSNSALSIAAADAALRFEAVSTAAVSTDLEESNTLVLDAVSTDL